ncbi:hypothetical protein GGF46_005041 [Coemansia sp. RSA 552]|nr:hypothetical protein GGF46_005041 [Coemansia sp. RSA 552]
MPPGNDRPREEAARSKSKPSLSAISSSLRRTLTSRRSGKHSLRQSPAAPEPAAAPVAAAPAAPAAPASTSSSSTVTSSSGTKYATFSKGSYTPSPLSHGGAAAGSAALGLASGDAGAAAHGPASSSSGGGIYGKGRAQRIASASASHGGGAPAAASGGSFRKTLYGSTALAGLSKSAFNSSSSSLVGSGSAPSAPPSGGSSNATKVDAHTIGRKAPPPETHGGPGNASTGGGAGNACRDYSFAIAPNHHASVAGQSARSSTGASTMVTKEGYLSKKTDINPGTSIASALSRGWKVYRVVLKGAKLFFYKPPSESELRELFPEEIAAATNETAGGYFRTSMSVSGHDDAGTSASASGFPMAPGEVESGSRGILFEPGVRDGEITAPLCERYTFGECFTEVDLRSLKFKRYVCVLIFDDTIVALKRRWVRQGLASSFFGAVSNKMRFGKSARAKTTQLTDNSSLVSAELGITGKGYFTKWKYHSQYPLANVEAIEAASSRFSVSHSPGMLGHLGRESQAGSGRISLYSIGNSSVSSVMTRTSTVSKDYSGALSSGLVPGFQIFVTGKERTARMFVATTSDAKNNWLSRFAAAKASFARRLRQRPRENTVGGRLYNGAGEPARPGTAAGPAPSKDASGEGPSAEDRAKHTKDTRTRLYWGTQRHPELVVAPPKSPDDDEANGNVVVGGSKSALVHEMLFCTTAAAKNPQSDQQQAGLAPFAIQMVGTYPLLMSHSEFLNEFQRYAGLVTPEDPDYASLAPKLGEIVKGLAVQYATVYDTDQVEILRGIVAKSIDSSDTNVAAAITAAIDRMVPVAAPGISDESAKTQSSAAGVPDTTPLRSPSVPGLDTYEIIGTLPRSAVPPSASATGAPKPSSDGGSRPMRGRSKTHHGEPEPTVPQIPNVPELIRLEITGLSPSLLLRISPAEFAHQLYLFHKSQLAGFNPKMASLYMPLPPVSRDPNATHPTPSLLTVGTNTAAESECSPKGPGFSATAGATATAAGPAGSTPVTGGPGTDAGADTNRSPEAMLQTYRQLMAFTHNEPHFLTRLVHHQLLIDMPLNRPTRRSALLQHWVRIGEECRCIGDAVSWAAIAMAITMAPIARLRETWHGVTAHWKNLIVSEWVPLLIKHGIYEPDAEIAGQAIETGPLVIKPQQQQQQNSSGASTPTAAFGYSYTPIPYYGPIRMGVTRQGRRFKQLYAPLLGSSGGNSSESSDRVLFAPHGHMYAAAQDAVNAIPSSIVERARTSIMRSRASSVSLASKYQQQQQQQQQQGGASAGGSNRNSTDPDDSSSRQDLAQVMPSTPAVDPSMLCHPYLQTYLQGLALNPLKIGDEIVDMDVVEYDLRFLQSISLQCEPSVGDQYHQRMTQEADSSSDDVHVSAPSSLRQAPGSILPLVCPETVPSTNILQWITPAVRTPASSTPQTTGRAAGVSGRAGTFSHASPAPNSLGLGADAGTTQRKASQGNNEPEPSTDQPEPAEEHVVRHKRSRSFPAGSSASAHGDGADPAASEAAEGAAAAAPSREGGEQARRPVERQASVVARSDAAFAGTVVYAANCDLALRVLRVQHVHSKEAPSDGQQPLLRFVVEVQGGTLPILLDLLINGIEHYGAGLVNDKGAPLELPGGTAPALVFNRDVYQRTFLASFRHFCLGPDVVSAMQRSLSQFDGQSWNFIEASLVTLLDVCENWLSQHFADFLDNVGLRDSMAEYVVALGRTVQRLQPEADETQGAWADLNQRAGMLVPDLLTQLLAPSGFSPMDKVLDRRLSYAVNRERRDSTASNSQRLDVASQTPLSLLSVAEADVVLVALNRLAQTHFARCSLNDWLVAFCLLEVQTHAPLPWYAKKRMSHVPPEEELAVSDIYQVLEQTHRGNVGAAQSHNLSGPGANGSVGGAAAATAETSLVRTLPHSIQTMLELHRTIRGWVTRQIADPAITLQQRVARIQKFLTIVRLCRKDSPLSTSRVFGTLLNGYMREAGMIPERQPSYRANSVRRYNVNGSEGGRRGKRKGAGYSQVKYVPSFVERAVASALVSPESRRYVRAWNEVAAENNTKLDTLEAVLRGARSWAAFGSPPNTPTTKDSAAAKSDTTSQPAGVAVQRSHSNPAMDSIDISEESMARADCFVPCLGWLLENMVSLCYDTPDTLVSDTRLINLAKRHRVFIMLCVCEQLVTRCQEAFALPTKIRIDMGQLSTWVTQTPLRIAELHAASQSEMAAAGEAPLKSSSGVPSTGSFASGGGPFTFSSSPAPPPSAHGFVRPSDNAAPQQTLRQGSFAKRSIANLRGATGSINSGGSIGGNGESRGYYARKSSIAAAHGPPDMAASGSSSNGTQPFGSPPAPAPRSLAYADGSNVPPGGNAGGPQAPIYSRPFARLVTDEVEKVRQEIRERERLERELRDREQAIERQKNERTKVLKRQLKEQQQRRAKNEPLLKMASLMNKVGGIREGSIDGNAKALPEADDLGGGQAPGTMRPRGPALPIAKPANVINLINSTITVEQAYTKRDYVFRIVTEEGGQYLLQATDVEQMEDWIAAMRDAATEAAARRLTLFVEEAKKRNTEGALGTADGADPQQHQPAGRHQPGAETTRSRFTAFLGGGAFGMSLQTPPVPNRGTLSAMQQQGREPVVVTDPKSFGIDLAKLSPDPHMVPPIVEKCLTEIELRGLEEIGIYRVSGAAADVSRLRNMFNADPDAVNLATGGFHDINVVSGVMKQFLRELPEPLMTFSLYDGFINAASIDDYDERLWSIKDLVHALPTANYTVLKRLIEHLERVTDYEEVNHMYGTNLALVFGPSLLRPPPGSSSFALAMSNLGHAQSVIKNLILQYHWIFNVEEEAEPIEDNELVGSPDPSSTAASPAVVESEAADKRLSVTTPLSPAAQADMDQLAMAVNKLSV